MLKVEDAWRQNDALEAGRLLFTSLPLELRAAWALGVLHSVVSTYSVMCPEIINVIKVGANRLEWRSAHRVFSILRRMTMDLEEIDRRSTEQELLLRIALLAENVAKIIYNETSPNDQFDEDSGWWVAVCAKSIADLLQQDGTTDAVWTALTISPEGLRNTA